MEQTVDKNPVLPRHPANATNNDFIYMTLPLIAIAAYLYGGRPVVLCVVALLTANLCDRLVAVMRRRFYDKTENSSLAFALIVTLLMPASVPYYVLIVTVIITVVLGKAVFGGYGVYPFVPPALGFAAAALSWPDLVLRYPEPLTPLGLFGTEEVVLQQSALHTLAAGGLPNINLFNLLLGNYPGSMGTTAGVVIIACAAYLWMRKRITLAAPLGFLGACVAIAYVFPRLGGIGLAWPWEFMRFRLLIVTYEILSGALLYVAVFLLNDETTLPKRQDARLIYGIVAGITAMVFRYYGSFDMGACFALLWVNVLSGPLDRWMGALAQSRKGHRVTITAATPKEGKPGLSAPQAPDKKASKHAQQEEKSKNKADKAAFSSDTAKQTQDAQSDGASKKGKTPKHASDTPHKQAADDAEKDAFGQDAAPVAALKQAPKVQAEGQIPAEEMRKSKSEGTASAVVTSAAATGATATQDASANASATFGAKTNAAASESSAARHMQGDAAKTQSDSNMKQSAHGQTAVSASAAKRAIDTTRATAVNQLAAANQPSADRQSPDASTANQPTAEQPRPLTHTQPIPWAAFKQMNNPKRDADGRKVDP